MLNSWPKMMIQDDLLRRGRDPWGNKQCLFYVPIHTLCRAKICEKGGINAGSALWTPQPQNSDPRKLLFCVGSLPSGIFFTESRLRQRQQSFLFKHSLGINGAAATLKSQTEIKGSSKRVLYDTHLQIFEPLWTNSQST